MPVEIVSYAGGGPSGGVLWHGQRQQHVQLWLLADRAGGEGWRHAVEFASLIRRSSNSSSNDLDGR